MTVIITFQIDYHRASELLMVYLEFRIYILIMISVTIVTVIPKPQALSIR